MDVRRESAGQWLRQPPLRLFGVPGPEAERLAVLLPGWEGKPPTNARVDRSAYCVAAYAWHYGEGLDPEAQRGLFGMLVLVWPRTTGRRAHDYLHHTARLLETVGHLGDDRDRDRDRMRAKAGDDRARVLRPLGDRVRETGELTPSWGIRIAERYYTQRADLLPEPLDPGSEDTLLEQLRLGPSWNYADPEEVAAERERVLGALRALAKEGKVQFVESDDPRPST